MSTTFKRSTYHLDKENSKKSEEYFQDIENLFGKDWLCRDEGHRLQILWSRKDHLATTELFGLGFAINKLKDRHRNWLIGLANNIKKQPTNAHGFLAELIVCSLFLSDDAVVRPAKKNSPGYDLEIEFDGGFKYLYSIKNHDISQHEKEFQIKCSEIKSAFSNRMQKIKTHGALRIFSEKSLSEEEFDRIIHFVKNHLKKKQQYSYLNGAVKIFFVELDEIESPFATNHFSSEVIVIGRHHRNEKKNQIDRLIKAVENMRKHIPESEEHFRWLWMRVHSSADLPSLKNTAEKLLTSDKRVGFDGVIFIQPSVVRNGDSSQIHTVFDFAARTDHQGLAKSAMRGKLFMKLEFPVGSFSQTAPELILQTAKGPIEISNENYVYQRTDYYVKARVTSDGWIGGMNSPASGVQFHSVVELENQSNFIFQGLYPESEELLFL